MKTRRLGRTNLAVSELALGGLFVSRLGSAEFDVSRAAVHRALELGINYIDTAPTYADSETVLGQALEGVTTPYFLSTKLGGRPQPFQPQDRDALLRSVDESLRLLKRDHIDLLMVHEPDRPGQYDWWRNFETFDGPVLDVLAHLKRQGIIRYTGIGGTTAYILARLVETGKFDVVLTAFNYNLLWREAENAILPAAKAQDIGVIIGSPLQQGVLARRFDDVIKEGRNWLSPMRRAQFQALYALLDETGMALPELCLRFVVSNPDISCTLMGARSVEEVEQNVAIVEQGPLPDDLLARVNEIAARVPFRPTDEPTIFPIANDRYRGPGSL